VNWETPEIRRGSPFADRRADQGVNREDRIEKTLGDINRLSLQLQNLRKGPVSSGKAAQLKALEQSIQSKWGEVRALRAGAHPAHAKS